MTAFRMADRSEWRPFGMADPNLINPRFVLAGAKNNPIARVFASLNNFVPELGLDFL